MERGGHAGDGREGFKKRLLDSKTMVCPSSRRLGCVATNSGDMVEVAKAVDSIRNAKPGKRR